MTAAARVEPWQADEGDLEARKSSSGPGDTARGMFFLGVLGVVRAQAGAEAERQCRRVCAETRYVPFFMYPIRGFLELAFVAARLLSSPDEGIDGAMHRLGAQATADFLDSAVGRSFLMIVGGDPRHLLTCLQAGYRTVVSYGERRVVWSGLRRGNLVMQRDFMPASYHVGVLTAVLQHVGARNVQVKGRQTGLLDSAYELTWS
ncbi:TIGR02265 family protein [Corallococcus sp. H22C18031201]|uniref:TIGR02265 family protein n=1 Tax=Citreicoccus inhibens TaxID=2849499 RepID=UPI000E725D01|nr:TIGR02265 family protein [Citreicoccus inhibens]MBU8895241.1 DUF2378 family protein [Citreicoccus inhibens]RJS27373.1 TIGR02265 family protein [Corallococcus sp. H22C18031201]